MPKKKPKTKKKSQETRNRQRIGKKLANLVPDLMQMLECSEFRIVSQEKMPKPQEPEVDPKKPPQSDDATALGKELLGVLAEVGTCLWDIEQKIRPEAGSQIDMKHKVAHRRAQRGLAKLKQAGMEIIDLTGQRFVDGMHLKVHLQPTPETTVEIITETVYPTIRFKGQHIQVGEVWVATPMSADESSSSDDVPAETIPVHTSSSPSGEAPLTSDEFDSSTTQKTSTPKTMPSNVTNQPHSTSNADNDQQDACECDPCKENENQENQKD